MGGVNFTRPSADRIAAAVREVEFGNRDAGASSRPRAWDGLPFRLKLGTFTGAWSTGTWKAVTLTGSTETVSVYNWTTPVVAATGESNTYRYVVFGRVAGAPGAVEIQLQATCETCVKSFGAVDLTQLPGYSGTQIQLLGHNESACLQWYSITTCATATA